MEDQISLRPFNEQELPLLERLSTDPTVTGPYVWAGFRDPQARRRRWENDGYIGVHSTVTAVVLGDETVAGFASWETRDRGGPSGGCYEIGLTLLPKYRGRGLGTAAQRIMAHHLFECTLVHRLEAQTDAENIAEQTALERVGFRQEGLLRGARFRQGAWRDMVMYGLLRSDAALGGAGLPAIVPAHIPVE